MQFPFRRNPESRIRHRIRVGLILQRHLLHKCIAMPGKYIYIYIKHICYVCGPGFKNMPENSNKINSREAPSYPSV